MESDWVLTKWPIKSGRLIEMRCDVIIIIDLVSDNFSFHFIGLIRMSLVGDWTAKLPSSWRNCIEEGELKGRVPSRIASKKIVVIYCMRQNRKEHSIFQIINFCLQLCNDQLPSPRTGHSIHRGLPMKLHTIAIVSKPSNHNVIAVIVVLFNLLI